MPLKRAKRKTHVRQYDEPLPAARDPETTPDWSSECEVCGAKPVVPLTGMCGPCTWGEAKTAGGNW